MILVEKVLGNISEFNTSNVTVDRIMLDRHDMGKPHQKMKSEGGETVAVSLPHGENMFCGAVLYKDEKRIIVADLLPEEVLVIHPEGTVQWAKAAFNVGNMHHPAYLHDDCILVPYDAIIENLIKSIGVKYERCVRKLEGQRAGHVVGGHSHHHHQEQIYE